MIDERLEEVAPTARTSRSRPRTSTLPSSASPAMRRPPARRRPRGASQGSPSKTSETSSPQILDGKLVELRVAPRRVSDQDSRAAYARYRRRCSNQHPVDLASRAPDDERAAAHRARESDRRTSAHGTDFCKLVELYTEDTETKARADHAAAADGALVPQMQDAVKEMKANEISDRCRDEPGAGEAIVIVQLLSAPQVPRSSR